MNGLTGPPLPAWGHFGKLKEKLSPVCWCTGILGRWAVIPVEFSSCTNKAEGITKAFNGGGREQSRKSPESEHLYKYLLQDVSAKQLLSLDRNRGTTAQLPRLHLPGGTTARSRPAAAHKSRRLNEWEVAKRLQTIYNQIHSASQRASGPIFPAQPCIERKESPGSLLQPLLQNLSVTEQPWPRPHP